MNLKQAIAAQALELGFDACGFTSAASPSSGTAFERWLSAEHCGEMGYLKRNAAKRLDPQLVLPGARSIVSLATSYAQRFDTASVCTARIPSSGSATPDRSADSNVGSSCPDPRKRGIIARFARYQDYHDILGDRLRRLSKFIEESGEQGTRTLWYVDTGPILERDLGQRAGVGFVGKHTNLIHRQMGNWFFLAEILTTAELEVDTPEKNRCGSCSRCLDACPTNAITAPFRLDARRCISYLTIELKGSIPEELRPALGSRIFGCDDCLAVCPWNRFARQGRLMAGVLRPDLNNPELLELLSLDEEAFKARFAETPVYRTKRRGLLRNVCVALGNVGDCSALPALTRATSDAEPLIAEHAQWAIRQIETRRLTQPERFAFRYGENG